MFAVREHLNIFQDAKNINKKSTKILGWRIGESPKDRSRHRFECSRSDHPSLFNFKSLLMREQMVDCAKGTEIRALSANHIVEIINFGGSVTDIRYHLRAMMDAWFLYHDPAPEEKDAVYASFYTLDKAIVAIQTLNERRAALC